jgi:hypothetical protein
VLVHSRLASGLITIVNAITNTALLKDDLDKTANPHFTDIVASPIVENTSRDVALLMHFLEDSAKVFSYVTVPNIGPQCTHIAKLANLLPYKHVFIVFTRHRLLWVPGTQH